MKQSILSISFLFLIATSALAQKTIEASKIINDIKNGKNIAIKNAIIEGVLDLTFMNEATTKKNEQKSWWNYKGYNNTVKKQIETKISFIDVTFKNDVLAYIPTEGEGYTYIANFENDVTFKNCVFKRRAMFKYSEFEQNTTFQGSKFEDENTFKYTQFTNFVSFSNTVFNETATFKYTKFYKGVSFKNANFKEDLNIKYTEILGDFDISNMKVSYEINAKYTKVNGKNFTKYLVDKH